MAFNYYGQNPGIPDSAVAGLSPGGGLYGTTGGLFGNNNNYRYGYQGQFSEYDEETGRNHFELRELDTKIGRWLSPDPKRAGFSPYWGMNNNPTNLTDPDGGCPKCPDPSDAGLEVGTQMSFATDGPHVGAVYELMDPSLGRDGWVRIDNAMLDAVTITPSFIQKANDFSVGIINPFVDFTTTLWTSLANGYSSAYYGSEYHSNYDYWRPYSLNNEWRFERININPNSVERQKQIMLNTANTVLTVANFGIKIPVSNNTATNSVANFLIKTPVKAGIMKGVEKSLDQVH